MSDYGFCVDALHCRTYCEIGADMTLSGSETGCSACVNHGGSGTQILTWNEIEIWSGSGGNHLLNGPNELVSGSLTSQNPVDSRSGIRSETPERTTHTNKLVISTNEVTNREICQNISM